MGAIKHILLEALAEQDPDDARLWQARYAALHASSPTSPPGTSSAVPIPLIVDGTVVGFAGDQAEADRWLARWETGIAGSQ